MGDWRTVNIKGKISKDEVNAAREFLKSDYYREDSVYYLQFSEGLCSVGEWVKEDGTIDAIGNVYERDCNNEDLLRELTVLAEKFPTLDIILHSGSNWESLTCSASFVVKDGKCEQKEPMIPELHEISSAQIYTNLAKAFGRF